jgi:hypothetical protein
VKTWASDQGFTQASQMVDRDAGQGPVRCCGRRLVAADALVCYDELAPERLAAVLERLPHLKGVTPLYLCDACSELIIREEVVTREDRALDFGLPQDVVDKARDLDRKAGRTLTVIEPMSPG